MAWTIDLSVAAEREIDKLDAPIARRILKFLHQRVARMENPRSIGQPLQGSEFAGLWRYRVGDYRILCDIQDTKIVVLVLHVGHRREIYR